MKLSMHTIVVPDYPSIGEYLLCSTRTQAMVKISRELKDAIDHFSDPAFFAQRTRYATELLQLHQMGILAQNDQEDFEKLKAFLDQKKLGVVTDSFPVTILTTYACNLKCTYCFQESSRSFEQMDDVTSEHVMSWVKEKIIKSGYQQLYLIFYGGEPLINKPTLEKIAGHMKIWCEARGIRFKFMLQTNGYLMDPECITRYRKLGLDQVRISVDGVGKAHDRNRPLRGGGGSFQRIMRNIINCVDLVPIGISTSYAKGEFEKIEELLTYFNDLGILYKLGRFIFSPIHATLGPEGRSDEIRNQECMCNYEDDELIQTNQKIQALLKKYGQPVKDGMSISICPLTRANSGVTIDQHGRIYKCNSMLGHPEFSVGNVRDHQFNAAHDEFIHLDVWRQCPADCTYMPMCSGGCRLSSFLTHKNFMTPTCHKAYLNKMTPEFIKKNYELSRSH